jgi:hypothetical protein
MACAACTQGSGGTCTCVFTPLEEVAGSTLIDSLTATVDCARDLFTSLGLRSYEVTLVWTRWTGGERGVGQEYVVATQPILPTPKMSGLGGVGIELKELGSNEQGSVNLSEISLRYTEDLLMGRGGPVPEGQLIPFDVSFYWEIALPLAGGQKLRRRFTPSGVAERKAGSFEWTIQLVETEGARRRDGSVE